MALASFTQYPGKVSYIHDIFAPALFVSINGFLVYFLASRKYTNNAKWCGFFIPLIIQFVIFKPHRFDMLVFEMALAFTAFFAGDLGERKRRLREHERLRLEDAAAGD